MQINYSFNYEHVWTGENAETVQTEAFATARNVHELKKQLTIGHVVWSNIFQHETLAYLKLSQKLQEMRLHTCLQLDSNHAKLSPSAVAYIHSASIKLWSLGRKRTGICWYNFCLRTNLLSLTPLFSLNTIYM